MRNTKPEKIVQLLIRLVETAGDVVEGAGLDTHDFNDSYRSTLIVRLKRICVLAGIDAATYQRLAPRPIDNDDPLFRELGLFAQRKTRAPK